MISPFFQCATKMTIPAMPAATRSLFSGSPDKRSAEFARFQTFGSDCAPTLRHSAIIFCTRAQGHSNQHGMGEGIMG
jgi:hypothetical protein